MKVIALVFLLCLSCLGQTIQERVKKFENAKEFAVEYDRFKKHTTVTYDFRATATKKQSLMSNWLDMSVLVIIPDSGETSVCLYVPPYGTFYNKETFRFLLDGELLELPSDEISRSIVVDIPLKDFSRIAKSKIVEFQVRSFESKLEPKQLKAFQNLATILPPR